MSVSRQSYPLSLLPSSYTYIVFYFSSMIDHILGRPNPSWKRAQVRRLPMIQWSLYVNVVSLGFLGLHSGYGVLWRQRKDHLIFSGCLDSTETCVRLTRSCLRILNLASSERFTPWQLILSTLTAVYALRNLDKIFGLDGDYNLLFCRRRNAEIRNIVHSSWTSSESRALL